jgi:hypothetical protein
MEERWTLIFPSFIMSKEIASIQMCLRTVCWEYIRLYKWNWCVNSWRIKVEVVDIDISCSFCQHWFFLILGGFLTVKYLLAWCLFQCEARGGFGDIVINRK